MSALRNCFPWSATVLFAMTATAFILLREYTELIIAGLFTGVLGLVALGAAGYWLHRRRNRAALANLALAAAVWTIWLWAPTGDIGRDLRFTLEAPGYRAAALDLSNGRQPACLARKQCMVEPGSPPLLMFTWGGTLLGWTAVVHDPSDDLQHFLHSQPSFTAAINGCERLEKSFYLCVFS